MRSLETTTKTKSPRPESPIIRTKTVSPLTGKGKREFTRKKDNGTMAKDSANAHMILSAGESWFFALASFFLEMKNTYDHTKPGRNMTNAVPTIMSAKSSRFTLRGKSYKCLNLFTLDLLSPSWGSLEVLSHQCWL